MMKTNKLLVTVLTFCLTITSTLFAANGSWTFDGDGNWTDTANWASGIVPNGAGDVAYFTNFYADDKIIAGIINADGNLTIGGINLNATRVQLPGTTVVGYESSTNITLDAGGSSPIINVNSNRLDIQCILEGTNGFTLEGDPSGVLMIGATPNFISGSVNLYDVFETIVNHKEVFQNADLTITGTTVRVRKDGFFTKTLVVGDGGMLNLYETDFPSNSTVLSSSSININSGGKLRLSYPTTLESTNITVNNGGEFVVATVGTSTLENDLSIAGNGVYASLGAFHTEGGNVTNNGDVYFAEDARFGQYGGGTNYLVQNGDFSGPGSVEFLVQGGDKTHARTFYFNGSDTRTGNTILSTLASHGTFEIGNNQQFPNTNLTLNIYHWLTDDMSLNYNLNSFSQDVTSLNIIPGGGEDVIAMDSGSNGVLSVSGSTIIQNGNFNLKNGSLICSVYISFINNKTTISNANLYCGAELMPGIGGAPGTVIFENGADANIFVTRVGIDSSIQSNNVGTIYLKSGSIFKTSCAHNSGGETAGLGSGSVLYYDGGIFSDGLWGEWSGSFIDWIKQGFSNVVQIGGANIEVNNLNGRIVNVPFLHDQALGGTADGGLTKLGAGTLTLSNTCSYTGPTVVSTGTLLLNTLGNSKSIVVADGATLGDVSGTLTIPASVTVSPGNSIGTMNVINNLAINGGCIYEWEVDVENSADLINVIDVLDFSATDANSITVNVDAIGAVLSDETNILFSAGSINGTADKIFMSYAVGNSGPENPTINGNNIEITDIVVPEPAIIGFISLLALAFMRRNKINNC